MVQDPFQPVGQPGHGNVGLHDRLRRVRARVIARKGREQAVAGDESQQMPARIQHREFVLGGVDHRLCHCVQRVPGRQRFKTGDHRVPRHQPPRHRPHGDILALGIGGHEDKDRDQHQHRVAGTEPQIAEQKGHDLPGRGRDPRRLHPVHHQAQRGAEHPPAIHGKGRDQVEQGQEQVDQRQPAQEIGRGAVQLRQVIHPGFRAQQRQHQPDHHVDRRSRQRHGDLVGGLFRHPLQPRQPADRQQRDVGRADAIATRGQRMAVFMRHHAGKR